MSWLFSQALAEDCSRHTLWDGELSALLKWNGTADAYLSSDKMMDTLAPLSRYGMTFVPLTADRGAGLLTSLVEDFLAKPIARQLRGKTMQTISGRKCDGSWQMLLPGTSLPKTSAELRSTGRATNLKRWATKPEQFPLDRQTWVVTTYGKDFGYLHTPTTQGNYCADSMQKHPSCRAWRTVFGRVTPQAQEWLMGWPIGWTDLQPLETDKFQLWQSLHFVPCAKDKAA
jgi:hypothetical protein